MALSNHSKQLETEFNNFHEDRFHQMSYHEIYKCADSRVNYDNEPVTIQC